MDPNLDYEWELFCNGTWTCYDFMTAAMLQGASRHEAECFFEAKQTACEWAMEWIVCLG